MDNVTDFGQAHDMASVWAQQLARGNRSKADQLASHIRLFLRRRFLSLGLGPDEIDDLVQECSALIFGTIADYDSTKGGLDAWLSGYARNAALSHWRGAYKRRNGEAALDLLPDIPEDSAAEIIGAGALEEALSELSPVDQELLQMRFVFGYSFNEIADMAGITCVNARKRVSRAVEVLRRNPTLRRELGFQT